MTLEELVTMVDRHRCQMAPWVTGLARAPDEAVAALATLLQDSDRELGRLCARLSQDAGRRTLAKGGQA